eukprot:SAG11_NODE_30431_length_301_cov_0.707921_1_plen_52_part_10
MRSRSHSVGESDRLLGWQHEAEQSGRRTRDQVEGEIPATTDIRLEEDGGDRA